MDAYSEPRVLTRSGLEDLCTRLQAWDGEPRDYVLSMPRDFAFDIELFRLLHATPLFWAEEEACFVYVSPLPCYDPKSGEWTHETQAMLPRYTQDLMTAFGFRDEMLPPGHLLRIEELPSAHRRNCPADESILNRPACADAGEPPEWRAIIRDDKGDGGQGQHRKCPVAIVLAVLSHCLLRGYASPQATAI